MKILVTGSSGRIGKHIVNFLKSKYECEIWAIQRNGLKNEKLNIIEGDLLKELSELKESSIEFDLIIHMAAVTHLSDTKEIGTSNYLITKNLINFLLEANINTPLIYFSSVDVYGIQNQSYPINTLGCCSPSSHYGKAKLKSEQLLRDQLSKVTIFRLAPMIDFEGVSDFLKRVYLPGTKIQFKSPYNRINNFSDISSICKAVDHYLKEGTPSIINLTNGYDYTEQDLKVNSTFTLPIPKFITDLIFYCLSIINNDRTYALKHKLHKLFKTNTYE